MTTPLILVTGATGATGGFAVHQLVEKGANVRALVHTNDERAEQLRGKGVDVHVGDLNDFKAVSAALDGVNAAYFVYPLAPGILTATAYFAQAARDAGVKAIINISQRTSRMDAVSNDARDHWFSERVFDWAGVPVTHLRPTLFMEWLFYGFQLPLIVGQKMLLLPGGDGRHSPVSAYDQGRVIAALLMDPGPHAGRTYHLYGPQELSYAELAAAVSEAVGYEIKYVPEPLQAFTARIEQAGLPPHAVQHLTAVFDDFQRNMLNGTNNTIEELTRVAPVSIGFFAKWNLGKFAARQA